MKDNRSAEKAEGNMEKRYAAVMGQSKDNKIDSPIDYYQIIFGLTKNECVRATKGKWCMGYTTEKSREHATIEALKNIIHKEGKGLRDTWTLAWIRTPRLHMAYVLLSGTGQMIY
jgi:hypothetical protein